MTVHPILLAWAGFTADRILHRARIAWDYARYSGDESYRTHAVHLGRYALSALVPLARTMIHEVVFEGTIDPWGSPERPLDRVDEWTVTHACTPPAIDDVQGQIERAWCWSEE